MKTIGLAVASCVLASGLLASAQETKAPPATPTHTMVQPAEFKWGPGPAALPKGGEMVVLSGDPGKPAPFVLRARIPAGYKIPPHWHPTDEHITVLSGSFSFGMGDTFDPKALKTLTAGGYAVMPAEMRHSAWSKGGATIQVHAMGPFAITYVNPADDPRNAKPTTP
ncbi:MAG: cupin domain-containing protein [bacterium]